MAHKPEKVTVGHDFAYTTDADLNKQISEFAAAHEAANSEILAMDAKRSLGPGKVRVTFRVVPKKSKGR